MGETERERETVRKLESLRANVLEMQQRLFQQRNDVVNVTFGAVVADAV